MTEIDRATVERQAPDLNQQAHHANDTSHAQDGGRQLANFMARCKIRECEDCGKLMADPPSKLCPMCQAYRDHQS